MSLDVSRLLPTDISDNKYFSWKFINGSNKIYNILGILINEHALKVKIMMDEKFIDFSLDFFLAILLHLLSNIF